MIKYYKTIVFANSILKDSFRFENEFQILPVNMDGKPYCPFARHFPVFLEYTMEYIKGEHNNTFKLIADGETKIREILNLLSCLTNHRFFRYDTSNNAWGLKMPNKLADEMSKNELQDLDKEESSYFMANYVYNGLTEDLKIEHFTSPATPCIFLNNTNHRYYIDNPIDDYTHTISFPDTLHNALECYYNLTNKTRLKVNACIYLVCDGMDISAHKKSLSFLSYVSAIEGLVNLECDDDEIKFACGCCKVIESSPYKCPECGRLIWGIKQKFINFLSKFVVNSEKSKMKYRDIYNLRSKLTHTGKLFVSDYEFSFSNEGFETDNNDSLMGLETLQLFRISLDCWLRYPQKRKK